ncbi:Gldg family protein [Mucilaginibacter sp. RS28]|uniref:Gldg family protein n=1 Tax=Mucilaginibacter straminoryzae TaxID=2932774 RepID=A0A9X2BAI7_9SPHI|nr:Gldg family protein [Mucilaginibacter straminoryzae]MCJ8208832.1 Gldg family protein [Mucilaginibacter straminoryzae]
MRKIFKIARLELSILFYSPVAWLVLAIFIIQCSIGFLGSMQGIRTSLSLGYYPGAITRSLFAGNSGLFTIMQGYLYLYLPILTMGLMSRETSSGSIKLLLSSPVKLTQIILGKYLAIIGYGLTLIAALGIYGIIGSLFITHADIGLILSGLFGLYLLICTYAAIGLFMSCLTTYQVVAAISTLAVFTVLRFVGILWQEYDFVRDLTYFLSISGRTEKMIAGLITTKDVFYYLIIICSFLVLCVLKLKSERELKPLTVKAGRYVLLLFAALFLGYLTSRPVLTGYLDATSNQSLTITENSREIAKKIDGELKVTTYANMLAPNLWPVLPSARNADLSKLEQYKRFIPGMEVDYKYYYQKPVEPDFRDYEHNPNLRGVTDLNQIADKMGTMMDVSRSLFMSPTQIDKLVDLKPEGYLLVRKLEYKGKSTFLRFYMGDTDPYADEAEVMAAIKRLVVKVPKVVFLTGNNERSTESKADRDYQLMSTLKIRRNALINQGFDIDTVNLAKQEIPADASIVVVADPTAVFDTQEQQKLTNHINKGGNMLISGEPGRQQVLNPFLQTLGVQLQPGILVKPDKKYTPGFINASVSPTALKLDSNISRMQTVGATVAVQGAAAVGMTSNAAFKVEPLLLSAEGGWNKQLSRQPASQSQNVDLTTADLQFNAAAGDEKGTFPLAVTLTRNINGAQQRIVVCGDADFISNGELSRAKRGENQYFNAGIFRWLSNGAFPIDTTRPEARDTDLKVTRGQIDMLSWLCKGIIPAIIAIAGAIILFKRRRN